MRKISGFLRNKAGATAIEYCMIAAVVSLAIVAGTTVIGVNLNKYFQVIASTN